MTDFKEIIAKVKADFAKAEEAEKIAEHNLRMVRAEKERLAAFMEMAARYAAVTESKSPEPDRKQWVPKEGTQTAAIMDKAISLVMTARRPLSIAELAEGVQAAGLKIGGKKPKVNLAGYLSRDPRINYIKDVGWWTPALGDPPIAGADLLRETPAAVAPTGGSTH